ncbi:hypothetical protein HanPI659440_Chr15g0592701 [Helianthus annuus]|nr:hypothetical protein HanPI659440_Chr15g0592701 [Helianthus annuus]
MLSRSLRSSLSKRQSAFSHASSMSPLRVLAIVTMAIGNPQHFFTISSPVLWSLSSSPSEGNGPTVVKNKVVASGSLKTRTLKIESILTPILLQTSSNRDVNNNLNPFGRGLSPTSMRSTSFQISSIITKFFFWPCCDFASNILRRRSALASTVVSSKRSPLYSAIAC